MNLKEIEISIHNDPILCFSNKEVIYFLKKNRESVKKIIIANSEKQFKNPLSLYRKSVKEIIIVDSENQIRHQWLFYRNQVLRSYQKYSLQHQKLINEKIYYASGQLKRYTEYDVVNGGFIYTENYDRYGFLNKKIGVCHVEK
nr:hypothetical protein [Candidatus Phytoplasma sacchari]KAB8121913.1 hypothetical protein F2B49_01995 [Candidatus Phytoplasma sacchari]